MSKIPTNPSIMTAIITYNAYCNKVSYNLSAYKIKYNLVMKKPTRSTNVFKILSESLSWLLQNSTP